MKNKVMQQINMADPYFSVDDREIIHQEIDNILNSSLSMGENVKKFENEFSSRMNVKHSIAMNSCTSTLEAALLSHGVRGKEVIIPSETFIATGMAVHLSGGIPVFAEISPHTFCLDIEDVKRRITPLTTAIIIVHMAGFITPDILLFRKLCDEKGLLLIEDAAHATGASFNGQFAGSFGHVGCFSFFPTKIITSGEGGMLTTNMDNIASYARSFQHRGKDLDAEQESYILPGRNVRMTEFSALIGRIQLSHLSEYLKQRRRIASIYIENLRDTFELHIVTPSNLESSSFWKVIIVLKNLNHRTYIVNHMKSHGIAVDLAYQPALHLQPIFRELYSIKEGHLPVTEDLLRRHVCLPCHQRMSDDDAYYVVKMLKKALSNILSTEVSL